MYINWLEYNDLTNKFSIDKIRLKDINLLVGVSGAGKTTILRILSDSINIIRNGDSVRSEYQLTMNFTVNGFLSTNIYEWRMKTVKSTMSYRLLGETNGYLIAEEELYCNNERVLYRKKGESLYIKGFPSVPQIPMDKSAIAVFKDDSVFGGIKLSFASAITLEWQNLSYISVSREYYEEICKPDEIKNITYGDMALYMSMLPLVIRLRIAEIAIPDKFSMYKEKINNVFPDIIDIKIALSDKSNQYGIYLLLANDTWVDQDKISSGILKTMNILSYLYFNVNGSLIIIDEIENSLGVNCLDEVIESIEESIYEKNGQAILTSHHPYIINNIDSECWKIISQKNGKIRNINAIEKGIGIGNRDKFFELLNVLNRENL